MSLIKTIKFDVLGDERGSLIALEQFKNIPFEIKRTYYIFGTKQGVVRGFHAHKALQQVAVCVSGSCRIMMDDGRNKEYVMLDRPDIGLLIDVMQWHEMDQFSDDCVLLVLANDLYDEADYIRSYEQFLEFTK